MEELCKECQGCGKIPRQVGWFFVYDTCPACKGKGMVGTDRRSAGALILAAIFIVIIGIVQTCN